MPAQSGRHDIQAYAGRGGITLNHHKFQFSEQMIPLKHLHVVLIYLAVIRSNLFACQIKNVVTFFMYGIDKAASKRGQNQTRLSFAEREQARTKSKWKAMNSKWRIRETALLGLAVLGGSIGAWLGMKVWHHKTQHKGGNRDIDNIVGGYQFRYGVPAIIIVHLALIVYFIITKFKFRKLQTTPKNDLITDPTPAPPLRWEGSAMGGECHAGGTPCGLLSSEQGGSRSPPIVGEGQGWGR